MDAVDAFYQYTSLLGAKCFQRRVGLDKFFRQNFEQNKRFLREHSAGRIRHFRAEFEQNKGKSAAVMICISVERKIQNKIKYTWKIITILRHTMNILLGFRS